MIWTHIGRWSERSINKTLIFRDDGEAEEKNEMYSFSPGTFEHSQERACDTDRPFSPSSPRIIENNPN